MIYHGDLKFIEKSRLKIWSVRAKVVILHRQKERGMRASAEIAFQLASLTLTYCLVV